MQVVIREFQSSDLSTILEIAIAAWQPVFRSSRTIVGDSLFDLVYPEPDSRKRSQITEACGKGDPTLVWVAQIDSEIAGFITVVMNHETLVAEIGNNAVSPEHQNLGIATTMYAFVLDQMKRAGMKSAIVTTGADKAHAPARRAYEKVGFAGSIPSVEYHIKI